MVLASKRLEMRQDMSIHIVDFLIIEWGNWDLARPPQPLILALWSSIDIISN